MLFQSFLFVLLALALLPALALLAFILAPRPVLARAGARVRASLGVEAHNATTPYARPGYRPVHTELTEVPLTVQGTLPADLDGLYLRNGTNTQFARTDSRLHMFNGAGMLHQVRIASGRATYSNCYVRTPRFEAERALGREGFVEFGDLAGGGPAALGKILLEKLAVRAGRLPRLETIRNSSATTAVQYHHGRLYCLQETGLPFALEVERTRDGVRISGRGRFEDFGGELDGPFSAHPKIDPASGDWHIFNLEFSRGEVKHAVLSGGRIASQRLLWSGKPAPAFLHDGFLTPRFAVFPDLSLRFEPKGLFGPGRSPFVFDPAHRMRFGVISRADPAAPVRWFETARAGHIWHTVNGWEEERADGGTELVLVAPVFREYPASVPIHTPLEPHATMMRFRLDLASGTVTEERELLEGFYERPSINLGWLGRRNRYAYLLDEGAAGGEMARGVLKFDLELEQPVGYFDYGEFVGGEALFVPAAGATEEDHGYLVELLMREDRACVLVIDARSMQELARLPLPQRVPYGVHGCWLDRARLDTLA
jgi:carotenoid cleavage dioxygenase